MKTFNDCLNELEELKNHCECVACDVCCAGSLGEDYHQHALEEELDDLETEFFDKAHKFLTLSVFILSDRKIDTEEFTFQFKNPVEVYSGETLLSKTNLISISELGGEGVVWFTDENGKQYDDDYFGVSDLFRICDGVAREIRDGNFNIEGAYSISNEDGGEVKDLLSNN